MDNDVKTTKTEVVHARITPRDKFFMDSALSHHYFASQTEMVSLGLKLMIHDYGALFANIARNNDKFSEYEITNEEQHQLLGHAYNCLYEAFSDLTKLTDKYMYHEKEGLQAAPNEYKDTLRDFLLPLLQDTLKDYEDKNHILFDDRFTEPNDPEEYMYKYPGSAKDHDNE